MRFIIFLVLIAPALAWAGPFEQQINRHYPETVFFLEQQFQGPISRELGRVAFMRYLHENGLQRPPTYAVPGIGCGNWTGKLVERAVKNINKRITIKRVKGKDATGNSQHLYLLEGDGSNVASVLAIASVMDHYVYRFNFTPHEKEVWNKSKTYSYLLSCHANPDIQHEYDKLAQDREHVLNKCNRLFGPNSGGIFKQIKNLKDLF